MAEAPCETNSTSGVAPHRDDGVRVHLRRGHPAANPSHPASNNLANNGSPETPLASTAPTQKRWGKHVLLAVIGLVIICLLGWRVEWSEVCGALKSASPVPLIGAFLLTLLFPVLNMVRWLTVLRALGVEMTIGRAFRITMACWPIGTLTPGKAGELLKAAAVPDRQLGIGSVLAERVIDVGVLGVFGLVFGAAVGSWEAIAGGAFGAGGALGIVLFAGVAARILAGKKIATKLEGLLAVLPRLWASPGMLASCIAASALNWFLSMLQLWLLLDAFHSPASLLLIVAILPAATFVGLLPLTIAGAGTRDAAFLLLAAGRVDSAAMLASSLVYTLFGYFFLGAAGLPFLGVLLNNRSQENREKINDRT